MQKRYDDFPLEQIITDMKNLNVRYMLLHSIMFEEAHFKDIVSQLLQFEKDVLFIKQYSDVYVYEFIYSPHEIDKRLENNLQKIPRINWKAKSNSNDNIVELAFDGDVTTRWTTPPQKIGDFFELDLNLPHFIKGISLNLGTSTFNYPRGYRIEISINRKIWFEVAQEEKTVIPITAYLRPGPLIHEITFPTIKGRYVRITNRGELEKTYWSIHEIEVFE